MIELESLFKKYLNELKLNTEDKSTIPGRHKYMVYFQEIEDKFHNELGIVCKKLEDNGKPLSELKKEANKWATEFHSYLKK